MQKTLVILEQNVQWLALALGGIFVLYCAWAYVLTPPATAKIPGQKELLYPGDVSEFTNKMVREEQRKMKDNGFTAIQVTDIVDPWRKQMGTPAAGTPDFPAYAWHSYPSNEKIKEEGIGGPALAQFHVDKLPELPKAQPQAPQTGLSVVALPQAGGVNNAAQQVALQDQLWVTVPFSIPAQQLKDAFEKILVDGKQPPNPQLYSTDLLQVDLQRQRAVGLDANGQPVFPNGDEGVENVPMPQIQKNDLQPIPDDKAADAVKATFVDTASHNMTLITQPKFYETKGGDPFPTPEALGVVGAATANPGGTPPVPGRPQPQPLPARPLPPPATFNPNAAGQPANANQHIDPLTISKDISGWAIDETVKPGQTYRYRIVYHMKNPVAMEKNIAGDAIVNVLDVKSDPGEWSAPVKAKDTTEFFLMAVRPKGDVQMDVFHWEKGNWKLDKQTPLAPGDLVPGTDWAVVDVHSNGSDRRDRYVLLTDDAGNVHRHYPSERDSARHKELQELSSNPTPPPGAAAAGGPPPIPGARPPARPGVPGNDTTHGKPMAPPDSYGPPKR